MIIMLAHNKITDIQSVGDHGTVKFELDNKSEVTLDPDQILKLTRFVEARSDANLKLLNSAANGLMAEASIKAVDLLRKDNDLLRWTLQKLQIDFDRMLQENTDLRESLRVDEEV